MSKIVKMSRFKNSNFKNDVASNCIEIPLWKINTKKLSEVFADIDALAEAADMLPSICDDDEICSFATTLLTALRINMETPNKFKIATVSGVLVPSLEIINDTQIIFKVKNSEKNFTKNIYENFEYIIYLMLSVLHAQCGEKICMI